MKGRGYLQNSLKDRLFEFKVMPWLLLPILNLFGAFGSSFHITLPPEIQDPQALAHLAGLNFYPSLYEQDPGWVTFIQNELNHNTPPEDIPGRLKLFLVEERLSSTILLRTGFVVRMSRAGKVLRVVSN
jgi:hypothetical protein